jgi:hypothetical protein
MSTWEMRLGARWIEPTRRNQVKNTSGQELRTVIIKIMNRNNEICSLVRVIKKVQKLWNVILKLQTVILKLQTVILKLWTAIIGAGSANLRFESSFSWELRDYCIPLSQTSLNWRENRSQAKKKRKNTIGE